jgi:hypothetical protein
MNKTTKIFYSGLIGSFFLLYFLFISKSPVLAADTAWILGRVYSAPAPGNASCPYDRYMLGGNCGNDQCKGLPNYTITWQQSGRSGTVNNNECYTGEPRYTFEPTGNQPIGDADGEPVTITISIADPDYKISGWFHDTTWSNGLPCKTFEQGSISNSSTATITATVYSDGDCRMNHIWFAAIRDSESFCASPQNRFTVTPGENINTSVRFYNNGNYIWSSTEVFPIRLSLRSSGGASNNWGLSVPYYQNITDAVGLVRPGETYAFPLNLTAPATPGLYTPSWQMVTVGYSPGSSKNNTLVTWFGDECRLEVNVVNPTPTRIPTLTPTRIPTLTPTKIPTSTPTLTPTKTPIPTATSTPLPTATSTPLPTPTSTPSGLKCSDSCNFSATPNPCEPGAVCLGPVGYCGNKPGCTEAGCVCTPPTPTSPAVPPKPNLFCPL